MKPAAAYTKDVRRTYNWRMAKQSVRELGRVLPDRLRLLAKLLARKPQRFTPRYARTVDEAFHLYTRSSTINGLQALSTMLAHLNWPFPAYVDWEKDQRKAGRELNALLKLGIVSLPYIAVRPSLQSIGMISVMADENDSKVMAAIDAAVVTVFKRHRKVIFADLAASSPLSNRLQVLREIEQAYNAHLWTAVISTTVPLLDLVMRTYFGTSKLNTSVQSLRDAFINEAGIRPKDLMPGSAIWDGQKDPETGNTFAQSIEEDLRLPGVYLSSFLEFADRYFEWYRESDTMPRSPLNRHAIVHGASEFGSEANAAKMITFLDLLVRLETPLQILLQGEAAVPKIPGA